MLSGGFARRALVTVMCVACVAVLLAFRRAVTGPLLEDRRRWAVMCFILVASSATAVAAFGVFSPAPMVGTFGIYFLCLGRSGKTSRSGPT